MPDDDEVRLVLPADADLAPVAVAAIAAAAKGAGLAATDVTEIRQTAEQGVREVLELGRGPTIEVTASTERLVGGGHAVSYEIASGGHTFTSRKRSGG
jgi:hypothetical protein